MTPQQKIIVIALGALNAIIFCCAVPSFLFFGAGSSGMQAAVKLTSTPTPTLTPTSTATSTPQATATLVVKPPATSAAPTITPRSLEAGWKFYDASAEGFAMAVPPNWQKVNLDRDTLAAYIQTLKDKNPKFASAFADMSNQLLAAQIKFFAIDSSQQALTADGITNMNVIRESLPAEMSLDGYVQASLSNLSRSGLAPKQLTHKRVKLSSGAAEEIRYQVASAISGSTSNPVSVLQYALVHGNSGYVITFGTTPDKEKQYATIFQKIMQGFQWVP